MISAIVRCYNLTFMLERVLKNLSDIDFVLLAVCNYTDSDIESDIFDIVQKLNQPNVFSVCFPKMAQKDLFNECVTRLSSLGSDVILINDSDEILLKRDRDFIIKQMIMNDFDFDSVHCNLIDYKKLDCSEKYETRTHKPVVAIKPYVRFDGNRSVGQGALLNDINLHHFGYALDKNSMEWKIDNLWYEMASASNVLNSSVEEYNAPEELIRIMK